MAAQLLSSNLIFLSRLSRNTVQNIMTVGWQYLPRQNEGSWIFTSITGCLRNIILTFMDPCIVI